MTGFAHIEVSPSGDVVLIESFPSSFKDDRCAHYDTLTVPGTGSGGQQSVTWGPIGGGFDFEHGDPIFDYTNPNSPVVLNSGWYAATVWVDYTPGQGDISEWAFLAVDFDTEGDNSDLVQTFPLADGFGNATISVTTFLESGSGFDALIRHQHSSSLNYQSFVFTQRLA